MPAPIGHAPYNKNGEGGRPKRYTEDYVNKLADILLVWIDEDKDNIFIEDWCLENNIPEEAVTTELIKNDRFSQAYKKFKTKQKVSLCKGSLKRKLAHPMCALILSHSHGMHQRTEQKISGSAEDPLNIIYTMIEGSSSDLVNDEN